jgi:hypothetical protein
MIIIALGALIVISGVAGLSKGKFMLSKDKPLVGQSAKIANGITIAVGLAAVAYALFGIQTPGS